MEERDEEKDGIFGVLGERQVGVVEKWAKDIKSRKANGFQAEKVIGCDDPEDKVYNTGQRSTMCEKYYNLFNLFYLVDEFFLCNY